MEELTNGRRDGGASGDRLINEAIKRILLDIVIRGHGDRLIGRWSREPQLQQFLEQVPYMLDRINQLHLACTRSEHQEPGHVQHHYHHHHHRAAQEDHQHRQTSLSDFIQLIGADLHWLVRTRDALGLTPLHKAVLHNNRPIVEYILDRYPDELAPTSWRRSLNPSKNSAATTTTSTRLIDAQDKYGRTALHYAAAHLGQAADPGQATAKTERHFHTISHLYHFLVSKGASMRVPDFKGKTAPHYVRNPAELRLKSIVHLSNKLNANYQANVLSKTLLASSANYCPQGQQPFMDRQEMISLAECVAHSSAPNNENPSSRESMSVSCNDLTAAANEQTATTKFPRSHSTMQQNDRVDGEQSSLAANRDATTETTKLTTVEPSANIIIVNNKEDDSDSASRTSDGTMSLERHLEDGEEEQALRQLQQERMKCHQILTLRDKQRITRCLNEGVVEKINQLLVEGLGSYMIEQANVSCWNQQCRRYINKVVPDKLAKLDQLHELIVRNQLLAARSLLQREPILARCLRPYRRASMNALHLAVHFNRKLLVRYLARDFPELVQQRDSQDATCLHWAARSLKNDRIYCWLLDRFGAQLEQLRDHRGKSAADFRQQALRLSTFSETHPAPKQTFRGASELLDQSQELSNRLLSMSGSRAKLNEHPTKRTTKLQPAVDSLTTFSASNNNILAESPTTMTPSPKLDQEQKVRPINVRIHRLVSSASTGSQPSAGTEAANPHRRLSDSGSTKRRDPPPPPGDTSPAPSCNSPSSGRQSFSDNVFLLNEFAELAAAKDPETSSTHSSISTFRDSPLTTPTLPTSSRPESASSSGSSGNRQRLDLVIIESIKGEDYKKLEHLILAGCGERLLRVYRSTFSDDGPGPEQTGSVDNKPRKRMAEYLNRRVPDYMTKIGKIYEVLHRCYSYSHSSSSSSNDEAANLVFHKLCNLLDKKRLIMARDQHGACLLHIALIRCDRRLLEYLLRRHPEAAASAPDNESRTALHYAAILLAAYNNHGTFRLTSARPPGDHSDVGGGGGFWLVNEEARLTYDRLCARYGRELMDARDKRGLTCGQYLVDCEGQQQHVNFCDHSADEKLVEPMRAFGECCPEYAKILARYNYCLLMGGGDDAAADVEAPQQPTQVVQPTVVRQQQEPDDDEQETKAKSLVVATTSGADQPETVARITTSAASPSTVRQTGSRRRAASKSSDLRTLNGQLIMSSSAAGQLAAPPPQSPTVLQVAPKPIVGSDHGFPSHSSPTILSSGHHHTHHHHSSLLGGHVHRLNAEPVASTSSNSPRRHHNHRHQKRQKHRRHPSARRAHDDSLASKSLVGGVIVPTIIHNDKMDEIETYDIIYRQPPAASPPSPSIAAMAMQGQESLSSSRSSSSSSMMSAGDSSSPSPEKIVEPTAQETKQLGSSSSSDDDDDGEDDDDERVERLSDEFESRVRREKSELRAKVDQIMSEIKLSAKSGKSSRFLASPLNGDDKQSSGNQQQQQVMFATDGNTTTAASADNQRRHQSLSSSGPHSASSSTSTSLSVSRTPSAASSSSSCSSATTTYSSASSASSTPGALQKQQVEAPQPQVEPTAKQQPAPVVPTASKQTADGQSTSKNTYGQTYLHFIASRSQNASTFYKVLKHGSYLIGERDVFYRTARDVAIQFNLSQNVQILDKFIIDLFVEARTQLLRHLLNQGYSPLIHVSDPDGNDIMLILKLLKLDRMIHFLLQMADFQRWRDELHTFIRNGYSGGVSELLRKHKDLVRAKSAHARTSLHLAVLFDRVGMVEELIEADPLSVHVTDNMGRTALHYTYGLQSMANIELIRDKLLAAGATLDVRDVKMRTPKYYYIFKREIEEIKRIELELN